MGDANLSHEEHEEDRRPRRRDFRIGIFVSFDLLRAFVAKVGEECAHIY
jgi:hypothetical protein